MTPEEKSSIAYLQQTLGEIETPKVLIVDDDPNDVTLHCLALEKFQCSVIVAEGVDKAIEMIKADGIDLILLDSVLPQQPSEDLIALASGLSPDTSIILVTGFPDSATKSSAIKKGAKLMFKKPLTQEMLSAILHRKSGTTPAC